MSYWIEPGPDIMSHVAFPYMASYFAIWLGLLVLASFLRNGRVPPEARPASRAALATERPGPGPVRRTELGDETLSDEPAVVRLVDENRED